MFATLAAVIWSSAAPPRRTRRRRRAWKIRSNQKENFDPKRSGGKSFGPLVDFVQIDNVRGSAPELIEINLRVLAKGGVLTTMKLKPGFSPFKFRSEERRVGKECRSRWS